MNSGKAIIISLIATLFTFNTISAQEMGDTTKVRTWQPVVADAGTAVVTNIVLTEIMKHSIHEMRPDRSGHNSWPSRHTSWAFTAATVVANETYRISPWYTLGMHTIADGIAMQRILSKKHYPKDVLGGAAIGILSGEVGRFVSRIFYADSYSLDPAYADWLPSLDVTTAAIFPLGKITEGTSTATGIESALRLTVPFCDRWGIALQGGLRSLPIFEEKKFADMLSAVSLTAGASYWLPLSSSRWACQASALAGVARNFGAHQISYSKLSFTADIKIGAVCQLTSRFAVGTDFGYSYTNYKAGLSVLTLSAYTRANF